MKRKYIKEIIEIIRQIDDVEVLMKIRFYRRKAVQYEL